jgi:hypothetical protein
VGFAEFFGIAVDEPGLDISILAHAPLSSFSV